MTDEATPPEELNPEETSASEEQESLPEMRTEDALRFVMGIFTDLAWVKPRHPRRAGWAGGSPTCRRRNWPSMPSPPCCRCAKAASLRMKCVI